MKQNLSEDDRLIEEFVKRAQRELYEAMGVARRSNHSRANEVFRNLARIANALNDIGTVAKKNFEDTEVKSKESKLGTMRKREKR